MQKSNFIVKFDQGRSVVTVRLRIFFLLVGIKAVLVHTYLTYTCMPMHALCYHHHCSLLIILTYCHACIFLRHLFSPRIYIHTSTYCNRLNYTVVTWQTKLSLISWQFWACGNCFQSSIVKLIFRGHTMGYSSQL